MEETKAERNHWDLKVEQRRMKSRWKRQRGYREQWRGTDEHNAELMAAIRRINPTIPVHPIQAPVTA